MALALTRKFGEAIVIDSTVRITVLPKHFSKGGRMADRVVLSIEAPPEVSVHRAEIQELIDSQARDDAESM